MQLYMLNNIADNKRTHIHIYIVMTDGDRWAVVFDR